MNTDDHLGYDPRPELKVWRGTPIPEVLYPLAITPEREKIATRVWCMGPPWTVLRNAHVYLYRILDYGTDEDISFAREDIPPIAWSMAIEQAQEGDLSPEAYTKEGLSLGVFRRGYRCPWGTGEQPSNAYDHLGYNPRPELRKWRGTPIPEVLYPLAITPEREKIATRVWCMGPPWTVLRNAHVYFYHVLDHGMDKDVFFARQDIPEELQRSAIKSAQKSDLSAGAYTVAGLILGVFKPPFRCPWPMDAHYRDVRPLANATREDIYEVAADILTPPDPKYFSSE